MKRVLVFRHVSHEGLGTIESFLKRHNIEIESCDLFQNTPMPKNSEAYDFVISMGGPMNVDETVRFPFLKTEQTFLSKVIHSGKPVLGVCLGAQMIARALDAKVYHGKQKEIGWFPIQLTQAGKKDSIFRNIKEPSPIVFQWHGDTFDLPEEATLLASSSLFLHQAFKFGKSVYAFQFHIEVTREMICDWIQKGEEELKSLGRLVSKEKMVDEIDNYESSLEELSAEVYEELFSPLIGAKATA